MPEIISRYTQTFLWLQRYDEDMLTEPAGQSGGTLPSEAQATALFARPRGDGLGRCWGIWSFLHRNGRLFGKKGNR